MRLHRFYIEQKIGNQKEIVVHSTELVNQLRRVFRLKTGDDVVLFDGSGSDYVCHIAEFDEKLVKFTIASVERSRYMPARRIYLCSAIVKKDNFEFVVEKASELGVTDIVPLVTERTEKKSLNQSRLRKIAIEASEQSGRGDMPVIHEIMKIPDVFNVLKNEEGVVLVAFHTEGEVFDAEMIEPDKSMVIFIGPEGGWSPSELDLFHRNGVTVTCLGSQVLRAETAVVSALSKVVF